jgi:DNA-binding response OmpR family regulator
MSASQAVLYVEDEALIREVFAIELEDAGFEVVTAADGTSALQALDSDPHRFCALITDINLGAGPDGWGVARRARELYQTLPVIYVTGAAAHEWGAQGVPNSTILAKPCTPSEMVAVISSLVDQSD